MKKSALKLRSREPRETLLHLLPAARPFFSDKARSFVLYQGDSLELLRDIPDNSLDMIFADPPYFLSDGGITCHAGRMVSVDKGEWDKSKGIEESHAFNLTWLEQCQRILAGDGTIWVSGTSHIIFSVGFALQQLGFKMLNDIVWYKKNAPPNLSCRYFTHSTETVLWAAKSEKSKHIFNYKLMKEYANGKQMRSLWRDIEPESEADNLWEMGAPLRNEKVHGKHPTQKPLALLERIIEASTSRGQVVLDPFSGSGTTGIAAYRLGRGFIGIEAEKSYLEVTKKRFLDLPRRS